MDEEPKMDKLVKILGTEDLDLDKIIKLKMVSNIMEKDENKSDLDRLLDRVVAMTMIENLRKKDDNPNNLLHFLVEMQKQQMQMQMKFMELLITMFSNVSKDKEEKLQQLLKSFTEQQKMTEEEKWRSIVHYLQNLEHRLAEAKESKTGLESLAEEIKKFQEIKRLIREAESVFYSGTTPKKEVPEWYSLARELIDKLEPVIVKVLKPQPKRPVVHPRPPPRPSIRPTPVAPPTVEAPIEPPKPKIEKPVENQPKQENQDSMEDILEQVTSGTDQEKITKEEIKEMAYNELSGNEKFESLPDEEKEKVVDLIAESTVEELKKKGFDIVDDDEADDEAEVVDNGTPKEEETSGNDKEE